MIQVAGCIFCGSIDLTEEHVIADWVARAFERKRRPGPHLGGTFLDREQMHLQAQAPPQTAKVTCRACNNGWLSVIDNAASAVLKPLIRSSNNVTLNAEGQTAFATWLMKTALVFDAMDAGDKGRLAPQRKLFYESRQPPTGLLIFAGPAPHTPLTIPGIPEVAGVRLFGLRPLDGVLNLHLHAKSADGATTESTVRQVRIPGYQVMLGGVFAYMCSRFKFFNLTDDFPQIWPVVSDEVELAV